MNRFFGFGKDPREDDSGGYTPPTTTAANDFQVGDGSGNWIKKTLAQTVAILQTVLDSVYSAIGHTHEVDERADVFNDAEGNASALGPAADGTSTYAARRDHVHAITNGEAVLGSVFNITAAAGVFEDTGLSVTLPDAGIYRITANARAALRPNGGAGTTTWWLSVELYNSTDAAAVANSERLAVLTTTNSQLFQTTCPIDAIVTVAASKTIKLYAARNGNGTPAWTTAAIDSNSAGRTVLSYEKIG